MVNKQKHLRVVLCGGLGNQLFQYAYGRALAESLGLSLFIDVKTGFSRDFTYRRSCELNNFELSERVQCILPSRAASFFERLQRACASRGVRTEAYLIEENHQYLAPDLEACRRHRTIRVYGYWQNPLYFEHIADLLRSELTITRTLSSKNERVAQEMNDCGSVAIHVRRVQYDSAIDASYYEKAILEMQQRVPGARFYCFSDDPNWCLQNLAGSFDLCVVDNSGMPSIEDFQLMGYCKHFIIANSSFSWWAAWLGEQKESIVISPHRSTWHNPDSPCPHWIQLPT